MIFSGEFFAFLTTLCWSIGIFPFTEATRRIGALSVNQYRLLLAWLLISIIIIFVNPGRIVELFPMLSSTPFLWFALSGIIGFTLGDYFGFSSFAMLGPKLASLYTTLAPGFALIFGIIILNEEINAFGIAGIFITIAGVFILSRSRKEKNKETNSRFKTTSKGILFGILSAFCQGIGLVLSKQGFNSDETNSISPLEATWFRLTAAWLSAFIFAMFSGKFMALLRPVIKNQENGIPYMIAGTIFGPVMGVSLSLYTISLLPVAVAQTIFALLPLIVMPLNIFIYKEKLSVQAVFAALIALCGVMVLIWRNEIYLYFIN